MRVGGGGVGGHLRDVDSVGYSDTIPCKLKANPTKNASRLENVKKIGNYFHLLASFASSMNISTKEAIFLLEFNLIKPLFINEEQKKAGP